MDYVVGSIAALISGNVTPNRPKLIRRALTPTKHQSSPNVTPKSEAVADRSIFLSPSVKKKKEIVKKSPKRIFENPDLDITENSDNLSPKADKVKKHLEGELEADTMGKSNIISKKSPSSKLDKSLDLVSPNKKSKINDTRVSNKNTPKIKKKKSESKVTDSAKDEEMDVEQPTVVVSKLLNPNAHNEDNQIEVTEVVKKSNPTVKDTINNQGKKKNKKRKKNKGANKIDSNTIENKNSDSQNKATDKSISTEAKSPMKKKNRKNKNKKVKSAEVVDENKPSHAKVEKSDDETERITKGNKEPDDETEEIAKEVEESDDETEEIAKEVDESDDETEEIAKEDDESDDETKNMPDEVDGNESDDEDDQESESDDEDDQDSESDEEISNIANPNAITEKDSDSEHDSDNEIESDNEESNKDLKTDEADDSSDDESQAKTKKGKKNKKEAKQKKEDNKEVKEDGLEKEVNTEEEIKRTLFVGNVPFSNKCKKEIKKIFAQYGEIETVRIRTVPVKDARVTPKLAVIKNEIHPDRSTVNVYVKFANPESVELALAENNTKLNHHHLRVSRSEATGLEHDPNRAVFLGNLPFGIEDETLRAKFQKCGEIESVRIVRDKKTNAGKGFGYVNFASKDGVELALELSEEDLTVKNRIIRVKRCTQTLNKGPKKGNKFTKHGPGKDGNSQTNRNFGNNQVQRGNGQGPNRNFGNNQRNFGNNQGPNRNFGNNPKDFGNNQGQNRNSGNNRGPNRNFGNNQGQNRNFGNNQGQNRNFGNNQGQNRNFGNNQGQNRNFGNNQGPRSFGNQGNDSSGASRRIMNKRPHQENGDGPPTKKQHLIPPPREKKQKKEFVGVTAEKKKKQKFDKGQKKKKAISEIMTKKT